MAITPECNPAAEVQGPGPNIGDGNPIDVNVLTLPPVVIVGPTAVTIADCADTVEGCLNDAANTTGAAGTVNGKLRGLVTILANVWDGVNGWFRQEVWGIRDATLARSAVGVDRLDEASGTPISSHIGLYTITSMFAQNLATNFLNLLQSRALSSSPANSDIGLIVNSNLYATRNAAGAVSLLFCDTPNQASGTPYSNQLGLYVLSMGVTTASNVTQLTRGVDTFKTAQAVAAGNTALWVPSAGKKFRLMRYMVEITGNASIAGAGAVVTVSLFDGAAGATGQAHDVFVPLVALAGIGLLTTGWIDLGNGFPSALANNVLNINLSAALVTGNCRVICCGTEE